MATGSPHLRVVAIDGVALEDAAPVRVSRKVESLLVLRQRREIREAKDELRRLRANGLRGR